MASVMVMVNEVIGEGVEEIRIEVGGEMLNADLVCFEFLV